MGNEEVDFEGAKPVNPGAQKVVDYFNTDDVGKLEYKELNEDLLGEYLKVAERLKSLEEIKEMLRANILKVMGREETAQRGKLAVWVKNLTRKGDVDYKRLLKDKEITEEIVTAYRKPDTGYQKIEVRRLG